MLIDRRVFLGWGAAATVLLPATLTGPGAQAAPREGVLRLPPRYEGARGPAPKPPLVMLDPGHGGKDPGAIGVSGTYEKHISLATAFELKRQLEAGGRYRVRMTRQTDIFIPLADRVAIADEHGAALFVSMHADALTDHSVRGASVYTLSNTASDAQSAALAERENSADRYGGPEFRRYSPEVARILSSLVQRETRLASAKLQQNVVASLDQRLPMLPNPARHARFAVLKAADIPSVLVEMGFMSNPHDEALLRQASHRTLVAGAMRNAVEAYFAAVQGHALIAG